jgi:hypothetical protein
MAYESLGFMDVKEAAGVLIDQLDSDRENLEIMLAALRRLAFPTLEVEGPDPRLFIQYIEIPERCKEGSIANWKRWWAESVDKPWSEMVHPNERDPFTVYR